MSKVRIIGKIVEIGEVETKETYKKQIIRLEETVYDSNSGEPKKTSCYDIALFNDAIDDFKADQWEGKKVQVACFLKSLKSENEGKTYWNLVLNGHTIVAV